MDLGGVSFTDDNNLWGFRITVPAATVTHFGLIARDPGRARMAIYRDTGADVPGVLAARTDAFAFAIGVNEIATAAPANVPAGRYWLVAIYDGADYRIGAGTASTAIRYRMHDFDAALPAAFGTAMSVTSTKTYNYWIVVE